MTDVPVPLKENARLRAVARLKSRDVSTSAFFDSVTAAAAALAGTPMSAVSVVGDKEVEVRSPCGLNIGLVLRGESIRSHTILTTEPLLVRDTLKDARFFANFFVVGPPYIRFYAGIPLLVTGQCIGALCVLNDRPREVSRPQIDRLRVLAEGVAAWLALDSMNEHWGEAR